MAIREIKYKNNNYSISYEIKNPTNNECIVFLHGWGSNKEIMKKAFEKDFNTFKHIYIDLPGFGSSSISTPIKTDDYSQIVQLFLETLQITPLIIAGHSFGGKVASLIKPKKLVLLSSAGIIVKKSFSVKLKIKISKIFKIFGFQSMNRFLASKDVENMNQTMYEVFKQVVDEDFESVFKNINSKTYIFWGKEDSATPLSSGKKIATYIKNSKFYPLEGDHFFFMKNSNYISKVIENE